MVELRGLTRAFGGKTVVGPIDHAFPVGKTTALIGPSGAGKSMILRMILGTVEPTSGQALIDRKPMTPASANDLRRGIGYVPQSGGLFPPFTAARNVALAGEGRLSDAEIDRRTRELLPLVRLDESLLGRYLPELSGGQIQRFALLRALLLDPALLLFDEALGALDPMVRVALQSDLKEIFARLNKTVIFVTHDLAEAAYLGDQIVLLRDGQIAQIGTIDDLRDRPASEFVTEFVSAQRGLATV